jgi:hypothetical protein
VGETRRSRKRVNKVAGREKMVVGKEKVAWKIRSWERERLSGEKEGGRRGAAWPRRGAEVRGGTYTIGAFSPTFCTFPGRNARPL